MSRGGVYIIRCRKPGARLRIPLLSWHFAYVGETTSFYHRMQQHFYGLGQFGSKAKDWSDLEPYVWARVPLPRWKWLLRSVETLVILLVWPVYNVAKNRWNPRRIKPIDARRQRIQRNLHVPVMRVRSLPMGLLILVLAIATWHWIGGRA
jgi:hypothetical protein